VDDLTVFIDVSEIELSDGFGSPCPKSDVELRLEFLLLGVPQKRPNNTIVTYVQRA